jgi:hypothetical protein
MTSISLSARVAAVLLLFCVALLVSGVFIHTGRRLAASTQAVQPHITNRTNSIHISNVQRLSTGDIEVRLLNRSNKIIYAYTIVTGQRGVRRGFTTFATAELLGPGETKAETIPARNLDSDAARPEGEIIVSAVYLEGGTTEGDPPDSGNSTKRCKA